MLCLNYEHPDKLIGREPSDMSTITAQNIQGIGYFGGCSSITPSLIIDSIASPTLAIRWFGIG